MPKSYGEAGLANPLVARVIIALVGNDILNNAQGNLKRFQHTAHPRGRARSPGQGACANPSIRRFNAVYRTFPPLDHPFPHASIRHAHFTCMSTCEACDCERRLLHSGATCTRFELR